MSRNVGMVYGITTAQINVGLSAVVGLTTAPNVIGTQVRHVAGGALLIGGFGNVSLPAGASLHAQILASGYLMPTNAALPAMDFHGPASLGFVSVGATATIHVVRLLGDGFSGQY